MSNLLYSYYALQFKNLDKLKVSSPLFKYIDLYLISPKSCLSIEPIALNPFENK